MNDARFRIDWKTLVLGVNHYGRWQVEVRAILVDPFGQRLRLACALSSSKDVEAAKRYALQKCREKLASISSAISDHSK